MSREGSAEHTIKAGLVKQFKKSQNLYGVLVLSTLAIKTNLKTKDSSLRNNMNSIAKNGKISTHYELQVPSPFPTSGSESESATNSLLWKKTNLGVAAK